jgi:hypothetical protein
MIGESTPKGVGEDANSSENAENKPHLQRRPPQLVDIQGKHARADAPLYPKKKNRHTQAIKDLIIICLNRHAVKKKSSTLRTYLGTLIDNTPLVIWKTVFTRG